MKIKQYKSFQLNDEANCYYWLNSSLLNDKLSYFQSFFFGCYYYVVNCGGPINFMSILGETGMGFNELYITVDPQNNLIYISEPFFDVNYEGRMTKEEFDIKIENMTNLELYQHNLLNHIIMTKNNFIDLLNKYDLCIKNKVPFFVLCFDGDTYDIVNFDTQENMNEFITKIG